ncbi:YafY family protein [Paenibacillus sp. FSL H8-0457]|uniref:helix-turn-helix transcriptional regulator n=1 Tax=unclassified Paenibacillus TaxID=185978 RepID=UPI0001789485|nr:MULTISPECIES: YafY family protein [unclassified Paenibacillus]ACX63569.1 Helix-turn-helix type 11 domain protein [Paenibacillus sp. Y412MC10]ETT64623.1 Helix-turn-helix type 11 domain-containing protein [Paenibacillus sp. FSL H8-457]
MKIDRLLAITVLLLNRGRLSAKELADRFEVSSKTIYRDMDTLCQAGIPIVAHQGITGGFEIMEHYMIDKYWLSAEEMSTLVTAVKGLSSALEDPQMGMLLEKIKALLRRVEQGLGDEYRKEPVVMDFQPWGQRQGLKPAVGLLKQAIHDKRRVQMEYIDAEGSAERRTIEPASLFLKGNVWYVQAFCLEREDFRLFRLSRMQDIKMLSEAYEPRPWPGKERLEWDSSWSNAREQETVLLFEAAARQRVADMFPPEQVTVNPDGSLRVHVLYKLDDWFYGMILSFGDQVLVELPGEAAEEVKRRAKRMLLRYDNPDR